MANTEKASPVCLICNNKLIPNYLDKNRKDISGFGKDNSMIVCSNAHGLQLAMELIRGEQKLIDVQNKFLENIDFAIKGAEERNLNDFANYLSRYKNVVVRKMFKKYE